MIYNIRQWSEAQKKYASSLEMAAFHYSKAIELCHDIGLDLSKPAQVAALLMLAVREGYLE